MYDFGFGESDADIFVIGDLVAFTGYLYTPDYVYAEDQMRGRLQLGIVVGNVSGGHYEAKLYRVHWLNSGRVSEVVRDHLHLVYLRN